MTAFVYLGNFTTGLVLKRIQQFIPVAVVVIAILFILRGMGLGIPYVSPIHIHEMIDGGQMCH